MHVSSRSTFQILFLFLASFLFSSCRVFFGETSPAQNPAPNLANIPSPSPVPEGGSRAEGPSITSISPVFGPMAGGTSVVITGSGFRAGATVRFGANACQAVQVDSSTQVSCVTPASTSPGSVNVTVGNSDGKEATRASGFAFTGSEISGWSFTDGGGATGINRDTSKTAIDPEFAVFNSRLFAIWREYNTSNILVVRVAVYDPNGSPAWTFVDGNSSGGINRSASVHAFQPSLTQFNGKLYAIWPEGMGAQQIRVAVFNGNLSSPVWTFVDGNQVSVGINRDSTKAAWSPRFQVFSSNLYVTWIEFNGTAYQVRVAQYNGNDSSPAWTNVDGNGTNGLNKSPTVYADQPRLVAFNSKLYVAWYEQSSTYQVRVAVYNGPGSWSFVDGNGPNGLNLSPSRDARHPEFIVLNSKLYIAWCEPNALAEQVLVSVYNGDDTNPAWSFVDGNGPNGLNKDPMKGAYSPRPMLFNSRLYMTWWEVNGVVLNIRVASYNSDDSSPQWTMVDGGGVDGLNKNAAARAEWPKLMAFDSRLFAIWHEDGGGPYQIRVAVGQ